MPADHRLRLNYRESVQHAGHQPIQPGKYQTVDAGEGSSLRRFTSQHVELMTKRQYLYLQRRSRPEQSDQRQPNHISHQPRASPNSPPLASRFEFPTMSRSSDPKLRSRRSLAARLKTDPNRQLRLWDIGFDTGVEQSSSDLTLEVPHRSSRTRAIA